MTTDALPEQPTSELDPTSSPFELQPIEGLPLTTAEKAELDHVLQQYDRERAAAGEA